MKLLIKRGTAARLGLRGPGPRLVLTFPKDVSQDVVERFIAQYEATRSHPLFVSLTPTEFARHAGVLRVDEEPVRMQPKPRRRRLRRLINRWRQT